MTDVQLRRPHPPASAPARHARDRRDLRGQRWRGSWRAAIRLAYRDSLRHKGSSLLIMIMIGFPVLLISGFSAYLATTDVTAAEAVPAELGTAQAKITDAGYGPLTQSGDATSQQSGDVTTLPPFPGRQPGAPWTAAQLGSLTGAHVVQVGYPPLLAAQGGDLLRLSSLAVDDAAGAGLATVVTGRLPAGPDEVAITAAGRDAGLPDTGQAVLEGADGRPHPVQVTGVVRATDPRFGPVDLVVDTSWIPANDTERTFLVLGSAPVSWGDVQSWNANGLVVVSRQVLAGPDPAPPPPSDNAVGNALVVLVCLGLILETTLLAGPAFAVSAARRRRSLALIGSNGAEQAQLTRYVGAQGLVLGGAAAALGVVVGTGLGWAGPRVQQAWFGGVGRPPLDTYALLTGTVVVAAVAAALIAAAIPARGAARLALAGVLSGQEQRARRTGRTTVVGLVVVGTGLVAVAVAALALDSSAQLYLAGIGAAAMVLGALPCIPQVLRALSAVLRRGPVPFRMAARDAARSHSRASSAIAATTMAVALLTILATANTSDDAQQRRDYVPHLVAGHGSLQADGTYPGAPKVQPALQQIQRQHPDWLVQPRGHLGSTEYREGSGTADVVAAIPAGCTAAQAIAITDDLDSASPAFLCVAFGSNGGASLMTMPLNSLQPEVALTSDQQAVLLRGGLLVTDRTVLRGSTVRLAVGTFPRPAGQPRTVLRTLDVPAALLQDSQGEALAPYYGSDSGVALMLPEAARQLRLPVEVEEYEVVNPSGAISRADEKAINARADAQLSVERGYESPTRVLVLVLMALAGALVAVAALISTALAQVEAQTDLATMAALGATKGFRRRLAAAQALLVALTGAALGVALGLGPGMAIAVALTTDTGYANGAPLSPPNPVVVIPWLGLAVVVVTVPLLAALVAAVAVRARPAMTRRTD